MATIVNVDFFGREDLEALKKLFDLAETHKDSEGFLGEISQVLAPFKPIYVSQDFIDQLNRELFTIKRFNGYKIQRAWDGGFSNFQEQDALFRLERILIFLCNYMREISFRRDFIIDKEKTSMLF
jgi:hypothetical protein